MQGAFMSTDGVLQASGVEASHDRVRSTVPEPSTVQSHQKELHHQHINTSTCQHTDM